MIQELTMAPVQEAAPELPAGLSAFLKLIADPNRLRIVGVLARGERCVCDVEAAMDLPQNLVSHHLSVLKREGIVRDRRQGKWVYYRVDPQMLTLRLGALTAFLDLEQATAPAIPCAEEAAPRG